MIEKPSQSFFRAGANGAVAGEMLLTGSGKVTDIVLTNVPAAAQIRLRDGTTSGADGRVLFQGIFTAVLSELLAATSLSLEFQNGLVLETVAPGTMNVTIGAQIHHESPDPVAQEIVRLTDMILRKDQALLDFLQRQQEGDPAV